MKGKIFITAALFLPDGGGKDEKESDVGKERNYKHIREKNASSK